MPKKPHLTLSLISPIIVGLAGLSSIIDAPLYHFSRHMRSDLTIWLPFSPQFSRFISISIGLLLLYLSLQLAHRKHRAYVLVGIGLSILCLLEFLHRPNPWQLALYILALAILLIYRKIYTVRSDNQRLRRGLLVTAVMLLGVFCYAFSGLHFIHENNFKEDLPLGTALHQAALQVFTFQESDLHPLNRQARWFIRSVDVLSLTAYALAAASLFRPLQFVLNANKRDINRARGILEQYSTSVEDYFKLWPHDKHYFFSSEGDAFVAYKVSGSIALILDGPAGNALHYQSLLEHFDTFCTASGWTPAIIHSEELPNHILEAAGLKPVFIGNEAVIHTTAFAATTSRSKHFRYVSNKAKRDNLEFEYWQSPLSPQQLASLEAVSNNWLSNAGRREYTFIMAPFDAGYIRTCNVAVVKHGKEIVAYANEIPSFIATARSIDHMRYTASIPSTGMHFLLMRMILLLHEKGVQTFNLGLSPLSGIEALSSSGGTPERLLAVLKRIGRKYYSFGGLEQFKNKFEPHWQPRYIYYRGRPTQLLAIGQALSKSVSVPAKNTKLKWTHSINWFAALAFAAFPLGYITNPAASGELVSVLGEPGEPFAWLFNTLDVSSGIALVVGTLLIWLHVRPTNVLHRAALLALASGGFGTIVAALIPLPDSGSSLSVAAQSMLHSASSTLAFGGILAAAVLILIHNWRQQKTGKAFACLLATLLGITVASAATAHEPIGAVIERILIAAYALLIIVLSYILSRSGTTRLQK